MCLDTLSFSSRGADTEVKTGFKVFERCHPFHTDACFTFPYREEFAFRTGEWLNAHHVILQSQKDNIMYVSGFHLFPNKADAFQFAKTKDWWTPVVFEVKYVGELAGGTTKTNMGDALQTIVADRMLIVGEVQEDPGPDFDVCL